LPGASFRFSLQSATVQPVLATPRHARAIRAVADLLSKQRLDSAFVGAVARAAYLGVPLASGDGDPSIDVVALMTSEQKNSVAMMASNRGFRVEREEIVASEELDLVPLNFVDAEGDVRVHVLVASNALYGRMVAEGVQAEMDGLTIKVPSIEDFALLAGMASDEEALNNLTAADGFDRSRYNRKLVSLGLAGMVIPE
jgi:hypothetical protein